MCARPPWLRTERGEPPRRLEAAPSLPAGNGISDSGRPAQLRPACRPPPLPHSLVRWVQSPKTPGSLLFSVPAQRWRRLSGARRERTSSAAVHSPLAVLTGNPTGRPSIPTSFSAWDAYVAANLGLTSCSSSGGKEKQVRQQQRCRARSPPQGRSGTVRRADYFFRSEGRGSVRSTLQ